MSDYMKEVERLLNDFALLVQMNVAGLASMAQLAEARAALLAHIQRGAVPEGWQLVRSPISADMHVAAAKVLVHADGLHGTPQRVLDALIAAAPAPDHFRDAAKMVTVHCTPTEHEGRIVYEHTSEPIPNADGFVLYAPVSDQFRNAAKMMAVQPSCMACTAPAPAEVPMPEPMSDQQVKELIDGVDLKRMVTADDVFFLIARAGEAAGYARGLRDAVRDAAPLVQNGEVLVTVTGLTGSGKSAIAGEIEIMCRALGLEVEWGEGAAEKHLTHADWTNALEMYRPRVRIVEANIPRTDAALRGEAKP